MSSSNILSTNITDNTITAGFKNLCTGGPVFYCWEAKL